MHLDRREFLGGAAAVGLAGCVGGPAEPRRRANLLVIMTDQQRWDAMSCGGNSIVHTPNIDRLAAEGVQFTDMTCAAPLCGPSRAAMLTGRMAFQHGCRGNFQIKRRGGIRPDIETYDEVLKAAGYTCSYHGKWHTGAGHRECYENGLPYYLDQYREALGDMANAPEGWSGAGYGRDRYTRLAYKKVAVDDMMRTARQRRIVMPHHNEAGLNYLDADHTLTAWTAQEAIAFLASKPQTPFSLTCAILAPHAPLIAARPFFDTFDPAKMPMPHNVQDDLPPRAVPRCVPNAIKLNADGLGRYISLYYGLIAEADLWVGRILDALKDSGQEAETLVVFLSDHGELMGSHGTVSKMQMFEEALRVPLILRLPGRLPEGQKINAPATGFDLFPTVLDLCGVTTDSRGIAGRSLRGAFEDPETWPRYAIAEMGGPGRRRHQLAVRGEGWKLVLPIRMPPRLYHLAEDPGERVNLLAGKNRSPGHIERGAAMREVLRAELLRNGDPFAERVPAVD
jgi:arylsulfatase A-like enzyme